MRPGRYVNGGRVEPDDIEDMIYILYYERPPVAGVDGKARFPCSPCDKDFSRGDTLRKHVYIAHFPGRKKRQILFYKDKNHLPVLKKMIGPMLPGPEVIIEVHKPTVTAPSSSLDQYDMDMTHLWNPTVSFIDDSEMDETDDPAYSQEALAGVLGGMTLKRFFRGVFDSNIKGNV
jgi:hypothetical protein